MPGNEIKEMEGRNPTGLRSRQDNNETTFFHAKFRSKFDKKFSFE